MSSIHSPRWHRVADLRPLLSSSLQLRRQRLRGATWYLLAERGGGRSVRLNPAAYAIAARLDGLRSVQQLWDQLLASGEDPPTQDEVIELLAQLRDAGLVQFDRPADAERLLTHLDSLARGPRRQSLLAWRVRLADPSALLDALAPLQRRLFSRPAAIVWAMAVAMLLLLALQHAPTLVAHGRQWLATPRFAALALLLYVPVKLLHELAHGLAVRRWGGTVRHAGLTLMMGLPVPWIDASGATNFPQRRQRIVVGAAGMMAELALAAVALPAWLLLSEGLLRDAAFVALFITGVSTVVLNANPLQRLDGYYIACDALALPNLGPRSRQWWLEQLRCRLLRGPASEPMSLAPGERPWLTAYAPLSWLYSLTVAALGVLWLGQLSFLLGLAGGLLLAWQMVLRPPWLLASALRREALAQRATSRRWRHLVRGAAVAFVALLLLPLPLRTQVQGIVWPPDDAQLRAEEDGFVSEIRFADGAPLQPGDVVLTLSNPALQTRLERQAARVGALETEWAEALPGGVRSTDAASGASRAGDAHEELAAAKAELERLQERVAALAVRAQTGGRLALPRQADLIGSYQRRGSLVGQVLSGAAPTVRVAVPESEAGALKRDLRAVSVRLAASPWQAHAAQLQRDGAGAVQQLPSAALSQRHGGAVATDPQDKQDLKALQPVVLLDVQLERNTDVAGTRTPLGERAWVRFDAGFAPLAWQLARAVQRALVRHFNPQF